MSFKEILLHVDATDSCVDRLTCAIELARAHEAHLVGLYAVEIPALPGYVQPALSSDILQMYRQPYFEQAQIAKVHFEAMTNAAGISAQWRCVEDNAAQAMAAHGRYTDLVMLGQATGDVRGPADYLVERVILDSPKPVLVIPCTTVKATIGTRIVVAWNGSREAVRAIDAAMPLLVAAREVDVVAVNSQTKSAEQAPIPAADICHHLARHDIKAEARELLGTDREAAEIILKWAGDQGSDLLVMGAYGHWRISEIMLGSMTGRVLNSAAIPVLLAH